MQDGSGESESKEERSRVAGMTIFGCIQVWQNDDQLKGVVVVFVKLLWMMHDLLAVTKS